MISTIRSLGISGIGGYLVSAEVYISNGLPGFDIVGLPDTAVKEARERVRAAVKTSGFRFPQSRVTVNLAPADTKKIGTVYDLPILIGILAASGAIRRPEQGDAFFGELSLSGELRGVQGALPMAIAAAREGLRRLFVPAENAGEAAFAEGVEVYGVKNVRELIAHLSGEAALSPAAAPAPALYRSGAPDLADVKGQENVKRALEIAAAGGHNLLMIGPPGAGKSMLARRLPGILPDMSREEMLESTEIHSVAGLTSHEVPIVALRPFRAPHHTVSAAGLAGGGSVPRPGEISLAHPQPLHAGVRDEPLQVRLVRAPLRALPLQRERDPPLPRAHFGAAARPDRPDHRGPGPRLCRAAAERPRREFRGRARARQRRAGAPARALRLGRGVQRAHGERGAPALLRARHGGRGADARRLRHHAALGPQP